MCAPRLGGLGGEGLWRRHGLAEFIVPIVFIVAVVYDSVIVCSVASTASSLTYDRTRQNRQPRDLTGALEFPSSSHPRSR